MKVSGISMTNNRLGENNEDNEFDSIVGVLQEILLDEMFTHL